MTDTNWDVAFNALSHQHQHPDENGGGMIGRTAAVLKALGIDPDAPFTRTDNTEPPS